MEYAIASDIGATNLRVGLVNNKGNLEQKIEFKTPQDNPDDVIGLLIKGIKGLDIKNKAICGIGVGIGALVNFNDGIVIKAPNFTFNNIFLKDILTKTFNLPSFIDNDANLAALGEQSFGAGKGIDNLVCLTLGTGIGGGIIINSKLFRGSNSTAGEIGHMTIDMGSTVCGCGNDGDLEALAGGRSLDNQARAVVKNNKDSLIFELADENIDNVNGKLVTEAALKGDKLANTLLREHAQCLAVGLANIVNILDPKVIILNGGLAEAGSLILDPAKDTLKNRTIADNNKVANIIFGALGSDAGILGAGALVFEQTQN